MVVKIIALLIGILLTAAGAIYYGKEKDDPESRKIYMITLIIGIVVVIVSAILLFLK